MTSEAKKSIVFLDQLRARAQVLSAECRLTFLAGRTEVMVIFPTSECSCVFDLTTDRTTFLLWGWLRQRFADLRIVLCGPLIGMLAHVPILPVHDIIDKCGPRHR